MGELQTGCSTSTFVDSLMRYVSRNPMNDRDIYLKGGTPSKASTEESKQLIFRNMLIENRDLEIVDVLWNYFFAVADRWPVAWASPQRGDMLSKTNGFRALMRFVGPAYLSIVRRIGEVPSRDQFVKLFAGIQMTDEDFNIKQYVPGTSGEAALFKAFKEKSGLSS
jgi:hypothetical protein